MSKLFICFTVLQLKIATRIMEEEGGLSDTSLLYLGDRDLPRAKSLLNGIEKRVKKVRYFDVARESINNKDSFFSKKVLHLINEWGYTSFDKVYLASIDMTFIGHFLSRLSFNTLITFDDGTVNINKSSAYYQDTSFLKKYFRYNYGRKYWAEDFRKLSSRHYTIYKEFPNIVQNPTYIPLFKDQSTHTKMKETNKNIKILLGTIYKDIVMVDKDENIIVNQLKKFVENEGIDIYIPHPRCKSNLSLACKVIEPKIMTEDFIVNYFEKYDSIDLYGFSSSAQLNLSGIPSINNYVLTSSRCNLAALESTRLFENIAITIILDEI